MCSSTGFTALSYQRSSTDIKMQRRSSLLADNKSHPKLMCSYNGKAEIHLFPPKVTSIMPSLDQSVINAWKKQHCSAFLPHLLSKLDNAVSLPFVDAVKGCSILDAVRCASGCWDDISIQTIANNWSHGKLTISSIESLSPTTVICSLFWSGCFNMNFI